MAEDQGEEVIHSLIEQLNQCSSDELEAILRTLDQEGDDAEVATVKQASPKSKAYVAAEPAAPAVEAQPDPTASRVTPDIAADPASQDQEDVKEVVGAVIRKSLQEGMEIQQKLMGKYGTGSTVETSPAPPETSQEPAQPEASPSSRALTVPEVRAEMVSPAPGADSGRRAPPPSPVAGSREILPASSSDSPAPAPTIPVEPVPASPAAKQPVEEVSTVAVLTPAEQGPTLETLLQVMKDQHQSVVDQIQWVACMSMPSTEYLTGVLNQKDADIVQLQAKLDQLRTEVQAKDDRIETQCVELNECVQECRHWLVDLEFHKQKLEEGMNLNHALEEANKNLAAEIDAASQQVKHASLDVEHGGVFSRTPIVTPRGITVGWSGYSGVPAGYCGIPMQGSIPWVFRKQR